MKCANGLEFGKEHDSSDVCNDCPTPAYQLCAQRFTELIEESKSKLELEDVAETLEALYQRIRHDHELFVGLAPLAEEELMRAHAQLKVARQSFSIASLHQARALGAMRM